MRENLIHVLYENFNFQLRKEEQTTADTKASSTKTSTSWTCFINTTIHAFCLEKRYLLKICYTQNVASIARTRAFSPFWPASPADVNNLQWFKLPLFIIYSYFNCACYKRKSEGNGVIWYISLVNHWCLNVEDGNFPTSCGNFPTSGLPNLHYPKTFIFN